MDPQLYSLGYGNLMQQLVTIGNTIGKPCENHGKMDVYPLVNSHSQITMEHHHFIAGYINKLFRWPFSPADHGVLRR